MAYSLEELSIKIDTHDKQIDNNTKDINSMKADMNEIKSDVKLIKKDNEAQTKILTKLDEDREAKLKEDSGFPNRLKIIFITAVITSIGGAIGAFIVGKFI